MNTEFVISLTLDQLLGYLFLIGLSLVLFGLIGLLLIGLIVVTNHIVVTIEEWVGRKQRQRRAEYLQYAPKYHWCTDRLRNK